MADRLVEVTISGTIDGQFCQNIMHYRGDWTGGQTEYEIAKDVAEGFVTSSATPWFAAMSQHYVGSSVRARVLTPDGGPTFTTTTGWAGVTGDRTGHTVTATVGPILQWPVYFARWVWGKLFMPGVSASDILDGVIQPALQALLETLLANLQGYTTALGIDVFQVIKQKATNTYADAPVGQVSPTIGTQRRREKPAF